MLKYQKIQNQNPNQLAQTFKDLIIDLAQDSLIIHNIAVEQNKRAELDQALNQEDAWVKKVWDLIGNAIPLI